jgi:hypothetical protein
MSEPLPCPRRRPLRRGEVALPHERPPYWALDREPRRIVPMPPRYRRGAVSAAAPRPGRSSRS